MNLKYLLEKRLTYPIRIAKYLAACGMASRRKAEQWVVDGCIRVNENVVSDCAFKVQEGDIVTCAGARLNPASARLWRYYKPRGEIVTHEDTQGRLSVFSALRKRYPDLPRVISVGRLDLDSEGLLLLTTQGEVARVLERPQKENAHDGLERIYKVRVYGIPCWRKLQDLRKGITLEGVHYAPLIVEQWQREPFQTLTLKNTRYEKPHNLWLRMILREGKNREIRRIMEALGLQVSRLIRIAFGPFSIAGLREGEVQEISPSQINQKPRQRIRNTGKE